MLLKYLKNIDLRIWVAVISCALSLLALSRQEPLNYDGILYLTQAAVYTKAGMSAALQLYNWPFYAMCIAGLSKITDLTLLHAAYLLNNIFLVIILTTFISVLRELGNSPRLQLIGALVILLYPSLNNYRDYIIRDFGYWAFLLVAFLQLLRFSKTGRFVHALGWSLCICLATLFRVEGCILLLLGPLGLLLQSRKSCGQRLQLCLKTYSVVFLGGLSLLAFSYSDPTLLKHLGRLPEVADELQRGWAQIATNFTAKAALIGATVLSPFSTAHAPLFLSWGLWGLWVSLLISALTPVYALLFGHAVCCRLLSLHTNERRLLAYFTALNFSIPLLFFAQQFFLSTRYCVALCLFLLLWVPASLDYFVRQWQRQPAATIQYRWLAPLVLILLIGMGSSAIVQYGYSKRYLTQAGTWINEHTARSARLYSNNKQILFYAQRTPIDFSVNWLEKYDDSKPLQTVQSSTWQHYDYLALRINHNAAGDKVQILKLLQRSPVQEFHNKRGDAVLIFKLKNRDQAE